MLINISVFQRNSWIKNFLFLLTIIIAVFYGLNAQADVWQPAAELKQIPIWPEGKIPDALSKSKPESVTISDGGVAGELVTTVWDVTQPTITIYSPKTKNTGVAVVVFPGGGFEGLAIDLEGTEICEWLVSQGITGVLLKYRVPNSGPHWSDDCKCHVQPYAPAALEDAQRAISMVRANAAKWHINPNKIGVIGFSAGGFMVADVSTHFNKRAYSSIDTVDNYSNRPDFAIALYPGHMSKNPDSDKNSLELNPEIQFTKDTPPTFLLQAENDLMDTINYSLIYYIGLKNAGVPVEMHLYAEGKHGFGLRKTNLPITKWPQLVKTWLGTIGMIAR